jgi:hypothetical protein
MGHRATFPGAAVDILQGWPRVMRPSLPQMVVDTGRGKVEVLNTPAMRL